MTGELFGEFFKTIDLPDGRARFLSEDKSTAILCYFKNGELQKGPQLRSNLKNKTIEVRGQTFKDRDDSYCMKAWIDLKGNCKTGFFRNNELDREAPIIDSRILDFFMPEQLNQYTISDRIGLKEVGS